MKRPQIKTRTKNLIASILFFSTIIFFSSLLVYAFIVNPVKLPSSGRIDFSDLWLYNSTTRVAVFDLNDRLLEEHYRSELSTGIYELNQTVQVQRVFPSGGELANVTLTKDMYYGYWRLNYTRFMESVIAGEYR